MPSKLKVITPWKNPLDEIRRGLRSAFCQACDAGDAAAASIAKTLLELETSRHEANEAQAPIEKKNAHFCPSCGQRLALQTPDSAIHFTLNFGGKETQAALDEEPSNADHA